MLNHKSQICSLIMKDCLYLNVYVPSNPRNTSGPLPVAVWLHGGAFMFGSGSACWFGPQFWMVHDIILVTLNYRLGPLGFLSLGTREVPGNAGMLDQVAALNWVQDNIHRFGGDPDNSHQGRVPQEEKGVRGDDHGHQERVVLSASGGWSFHIRPLPS